MPKHTRIIRLPVHQEERLRRIRKFERQHIQEFGNPPEMAALAAGTGYDPQIIKDLLRDSQMPLGLDEPIGDDSTFGDFQPSPGQNVEEAVINDRLLQDGIWCVLSDTLTPKEIRILALRFGLRDGCSLTLQQVAERFGLTRERIRQIEKAALAKLREPRAVERLVDFLR